MSSRACVDSSLRARLLSAALGGKTRMIIKGFRLPAPFPVVARHLPPGGLVGWELKKLVDAYGNPFESEVSELYGDRASILRATDELPEHFRPDGYYGEPRSPGGDEYGFIPDIVDFSGVICFGADGGGSPFCFDFRGDARDPSVIYWADAWWRRVAPDFGSFLALYNVGDVA